MRTDFAMSHIPVYVYFIFIALLWVGVTRCFRRTIRIRRLLIMPLLFAALGFRGFFGLFQHPVDRDILAALLGLAIGLALGWHHARRWTIAIDRQAGQITVPGDIMMFAIILGSFAFEFTLHYGIESRASWVAVWPVQPIAAGVWAWFLGMTAGRNVNLALRYRDQQAVPVPEAS